jgi:hypothetical protein
VPPCMILLEISALAAGCRLLELALELGLLLLAPSVAVFPLAFTHVVHKRGCRGGREGGREGGRLASARPSRIQTLTDKATHPASCTLWFRRLSESPCSCVQDKVPLYRETCLGTRLLSLYDHFTMQQPRHAIESRITIAGYKL